MHVRCRAHPYRERLRHDPQFALELTFCFEFARIPHSAFWEWDPDDQAKALAWMLERNSRCQMCGTADWEWEDDRFAYEPQEKICRGCELKDMVNEDAENTPGRQVVLIPKGAISAKVRKDQRQKYLRDQRARQEEKAQRDKSPVTAARPVEVRWD